MAGVKLEDCVRKFSIPEDLLDTAVSDEHIWEVSRFLQWRRVALYLKLDDSEVEAVEVDGKNEEDKRLKSLQQWKRKFGFMATYKSLIEALLKSARADHAGEVCKLLASLAPRKGLVDSEDTQTQRSTRMRQLQSGIQSLRENKGRLQPEEKNAEISKLERELKVLRDQNVDKDKKLTSAAVQSQRQQLQLTEKEAELRQRDAELNRLQRELREQTAAKQKTLAAFQPQQPHARPSSALQLPLNLRWRQYKDLPRGRQSPYCVIVEGKLYIGGGYTVWQYESEQWLKLTQYEYRSFAMTSLRGHLTLVGGVDPYTPSCRVTNVIAVWDRKGVSHQWTHPYPPMPTPRYSPAVATHNQWLLVAGGDDRYPTELAAVDLLNTDNRQWLSTTPLPVKCCHVTAAIVQEQLYLVGGTLTTTLVVSLPDLLSIDSANTTKTWRTLPAPPLERSAAISVRGTLLAVGGCHGKDRSTAIHIYQPATNNWEKVGDLPSARSHCTCTLLPSGELFTAGGFDSNGKRTSRVDVAAM